MRAAVPDRGRVNRWWLLFAFRLLGVLALPMMILTIVAARADGSVAWLAPFTFVVLATCGIVGLVVPYWDAWHAGARGVVATQREANWRMSPDFAESTSKVDPGVGRIRRQARSATAATIVLAVALIALAAVAAP